MTSDVARLAAVFEYLDVPWSWDGKVLIAAGRVYKANEAEQIIDIREGK